MSKLTDTTTKRPEGRPVYAARGESLSRFPLRRDACEVLVSCDRFQDEEAGEPIEFLSYGKELSSIKPEGVRIPHPQSALRRVMDRPDRTGFANVLGHRSFLLSMGKP